MIFNERRQARQAMKKSTEVFYWNAGLYYIGRLDAEREDGMFHFKGVRKGRTEEIDTWDNPIMFGIEE